MTLLLHHLLPQDKIGYKRGKGKGCSMFLSLYILSPFFLLYSLITIEVERKIFLFLLYSIKNNSLLHFFFCGDLSLSEWNFELNEATRIYWKWCVWHIFLSLFISFCDLWFHNKRSHAFVQNINNDKFCQYIDISNWILIKS